VWLRKGPTGEQEPRRASDDAAEIPVEGQNRSVSEEIPEGLACGIGP
jgi:hypothetical protein